MDQLRKGEHLYMDGDLRDCRSLHAQGDGQKDRWTDRQAHRQTAGPGIVARLILRNAHEVVEELSREVVTRVATETSNGIPRQVNRPRLDVHQAEMANKGKKVKKSIGRRR
jgi:hypothetical protein